MNIKSNKGELLINGQKIGDGIGTIEFCAPEDNVLAMAGGPRFEGTIVLTVKSPKLDMYSLFYGRKITNNWLKMNGGIMVRGDKNKRRNKKRKMKRK